MKPKNPRVNLPEEIPGFCILYWRLVRHRHGLTLPHLCLLSRLIVGYTGKDLLPESLKQSAKDIVSLLIEHNPKKLAAKYKLEWGWSWKGCEWAKCGVIDEIVIGYHGVVSDKPIEWLIERYSWQSSSKENDEWTGISKQHRLFAKEIAKWMEEVRAKK